MFRRESNRQMDLDNFWDELIEKSSWAKKNAGKFGNDFRNLEILESKPIKSGMFSEGVDRDKITKIKYRKIIIAISIFTIIILFLVVFFVAEAVIALKKDAGCDGGVWSVSTGKCVRTIDYCNKKYALNSVFSEDSCQCLEGYIKDGDNCKKVEDCSRFGNVYLGSDNTCKCSAGYIMKEGKCQINDQVAPLFSSTSTSETISSLIKN